VPAWQRLGVEQRPPEPKSGIPRQWVPRPLRVAFRLALYPWILLDLAAQRLILMFVRPGFVVSGTCKKRGACCHYTVMPVADGGFWGAFDKVMTWWLTQVQGFYPRGFEVDGPDGDPWRVMGCRHLTEQGSCGSYFLRPTICRKWPRVSVWDSPKVLKGCGYVVEPTHRLPIITE